MRTKANIGVMAPEQAAQGTSSGMNPLSEADTFADFFSGHHLSVFRYIYALHGHPQETVEDLTAETFLKAWRARQSFSGDENGALRWVLRIARNLVIDTYRRTGGYPDLDDISAIALAAEGSGPEDLIIQSESVDSLLQAIQSLPRNQREMITLRYVLGWRVKDIADQLEMLENTVSVNLRRALAAMRKNWPKESYKEGR
jgi:RNA polymerase sigma-70 factor (ECF subfamily)